MIKIGVGNWLKDLNALTEPLGASFWNGFTPASEKQLDDAEKLLMRKFDPEFREFYRAVGYGEFGDYLGGGFDSPDDFMFGVGPSIFFMTGSLMPGAEWANAEEHKRLWLSRGRDNPTPRRFTEEAMTFECVKLYDLLQFGSDGCCCYHQLYVGPSPAPLAYCLLTDSQTMESRASTFSEGLEKILAFHLNVGDE